MPKLLFRIVAFFLVPCLIADQSFALGLNNSLAISRITISTNSQTSLWQTEALSVPGLTESPNNRLDPENRAFLSRLLPKAVKITGTVAAPTIGVDLLSKMYGATP